MTRLTIMLLTYSPGLESPRSKYAARALAETLFHLRTSCDISVHIADDGSPEEHRRFLRQVAFDSIGEVEVSETNSQRRGYGASYNLATQAIHNSTDYVLPLEDDWVLTKDFNIDGHLRALDHGIFGCVRLGYLGTTQTLIAHAIHVAGETYWNLHADSPEPHVFAGHPRLETVAWERSVGPWPEGLGPGETEFEVAKRARTGIVWPVDGGRWHHVGTVQARTDQGEERCPQS